MSKLDRAVCFTVHGLPHLRTALKAGTEAGRPIIVLSAEAASAYAGALWFAAMIQAGREEFPDAQLTAILDCGDRAGDVLAALQAGIACVIFTGHPEAARRLTAIAAVTGATILAERPVSFDLLNLRDPEFAARRRCADPN